MIIYNDAKLDVAFADEGVMEAHDYIVRTPTHSSYSWTGFEVRQSTEHFEKVRNMMRDGWSKGADMVSHVLGNAVPPNAAGVSKWRMDIAGELPDVARYVAGNPAHMRRHVRRQGAQPIVHILLNTARRGDATDKQKINYCAAICGLVDLLERSGRRVELDRVGVVAANGRASIQGWKVKRAEDAMDLAAMAFAIIHPGAHEGGVWAMRVRRPIIRWLPASMCKEYAASIGAAEALLIDGLLNDGEQANTPEGAYKLAVRRLNKAAGETLIEEDEL